MNSYIHEVTAGLVVTDTMRNRKTSSHLKPRSWMSCKVARKESGIGPRCGLKLHRHIYFYMTLENLESPPGRSTVYCWILVEVCFVDFRGVPTFFARLLQVVNICEFDQSSMIQYNGTNR